MKANRRQRKRQNKKRRLASLKKRTLNNISKKKGSKNDVITKKLGSTKQNGSATKIINDENPIIDNKPHDPAYKVIDLGSTKQNGSATKIINDENPIIDNKPQYPAFKVIDFGPNKGMGVVALRRIKFGEELVIEKPLIELIYDSVSQSNPKENVLFKNFKKLDIEKRAEALNLASKTNVKLVKDCHKNPDNLIYTESSIKKRLSCVFDTNAVPRGAGSPDGVLCGLTARFNHSCKPNVLAAYCESKRRERVYAIRSIEKGEEICSNYGGFYFPYRERRTYFIDNFGFECTCEACSNCTDRVSKKQIDDKQFKKLQRISDRRRVEIQELDHEYAELVAEGDIESSLEVLQELIQLLEAEFGKYGEGIPLPLLARYAEDGFKLSARLDRPESELKDWLGKVAECKAIIYGISSSEYLSAEQYHGEPGLHPFFLDRPADDGDMET